MEQAIASINLPLSVSGWLGKHPFDLQIECRPQLLNRGFICQQEASQPGSHGREIQREEGACSLKWLDVLAYLAASLRVLHQLRELRDELLILSGKLLMIRLFTGMEKELLEKMPRVLRVLLVKFEKWAEDMNKRFQQRHVCGESRERLLRDFRERVGIDHNQEFCFIPGIQEKRACADLCGLSDLASRGLLEPFLLE